MSRPILDLDSLVIEVPSIRLPDGTIIELRRLSTQEVMSDLLRQLNTLGDSQDAMLRFSDILLGLAEDPEAARPSFERLPVDCLADILLWIQKAEVVQYVVRDEPVALVKLAERERAVRPLTVGMYRAATREGAGEEELADRAMANLAMLAATIDDTTVEELLALDHGRRRALEAFITDATQKAVEGLKEARPSRRRARAR